MIERLGLGCDLGCCEQAYWSGSVENLGLNKPGLSLGRVWQSEGNGCFGLLGFLPSRKVV